MGPTTPIYKFEKPYGHFTSYFEEERRHFDSKRIQWSLMDCVYAVPPLKNPLCTFQGTFNKIKQQIFRIVCLTKLYLKAITRRKMRICNHFWVYCVYDNLMYLWSRSFLLHDVKEKWISSSLKSWAKNKVQTTINGTSQQMKFKHLHFGRKFGIEGIERSTRGSRHKSRLLLSLSWHKICIVFSLSCGKVTKVCHRLLSVGHIIFNGALCELSRLFLLRKWMKLVQKVFNYQR